MSTEKPDNPRLIDIEEASGISSSITLRDLFAAFAMAGLLANPNVDMNDDDGAECAYGKADAMLAEREPKR